MEYNTAKTAWQPIHFCKLKEHSSYPQRASGLGLLTHLLTVVLCKSKHFSQWISPVPRSRRFWVKPEGQNCEPEPVPELAEPEPDWTRTSVQFCQFWFSDPELDRTSATLVYSVAHSEGLGSLGANAITAHVPSGEKGIIERRRTKAVTMCINTEDTRYWLIFSCWGKKEKTWRTSLKR